MSAGKRLLAVVLTGLSGFGICIVGAILPFVPFALAISVSVVAMPWMLRAMLKQLGQPVPGDLTAAAKLLGWLALHVSGGIGFLAAGVIPGMNPDRPRGGALPFATELAPIGLFIGALLGLVVMAAVRLLAARMDDKTAAPLQSPPSSS